jgi:sec-independent protein translocase protein TatA
MGIDNPVHLVFLGVIALVVLGPRRLPELAKALGNGIREFRESVDLGQHQAPPTPPPAAAAPVVPPVPPPVADDEGAESP